MPKPMKIPMLKHQNPEKLLKSLENLESLKKSKANKRITNGLEQGKLPLVPQMPKVNKFNQIADEIRRKLIDELYLENIPKNRPDLVEEKLRMLRQKWGLAIRRLLFRMILENPEWLASFIKADIDNTVSAITARLRIEDFDKYRLVYAKLKQDYESMFFAELRQVLYTFARFANKKLKSMRTLKITRKITPDEIRAANTLFDLFTEAGVVIPERKVLLSEVNGFYSNPLMITAGSIHGGNFNSAIKYFSEVYTRIMEGNITSLDLDTLLSREYQACGLYTIPNSKSGGMPLEKIFKYRGKKVFGINPIRRHVSVFIHELVHYLLDYSAEHGHAKNRQITHNEFVVEYLTQLVYAHCFPKLYDEYVDAMANFDRRRSRDPLNDTELLQIGFDTEQIAKTIPYQLAGDVAIDHIVQNRANLKPFILQEIKRVIQLS